MKPSVGRIVHYVSFGTPGGEYPTACRAALVTETDATNAGRVGLAVLNPTGAFFRSLSDGGSWNDETAHAGGTWHWPEREES